MSKKRIAIVAGVLLFMFCGLATGGVYYYKTFHPPINITIPILTADKSPAENPGSLVIPLPVAATKAVVVVQSYTSRSVASQKVTRAVTEPLSYNTVRLSRVDFSGDYVLPDGMTFTNVEEVYINGQPVNRSRVTLIYMNTGIDIWDAQLNSVVTALVSK